MGVPLEPELLIFSLFPGNDLYDERNFASWEEAGRPVPYHVWKGAGGIPTSTGPLSRAMSNSYVVALLRGAMKTMRAPGANTTIVLESGSSMDLTPSIYTSTAAEARPGNPDFDRVVDSVVRARDLAAEQGARFAVLMMPTKERIYMPMVGQEPPDLMGGFIETFKKQGVAVIDPTDILRAAAEQGKQLFFSTDGHPNIAGNRVIARCVERWLKGQPNRAGLGQAS